MPKLINSFQLVIETLLRQCFLREQQISQLGKVMFKILISNIMKSSKNFSSQEKSLASKYGQYLNKNFGLTDLKRSFKKAKSVKRHSHNKPVNQMLMTTDNLFGKLGDKKSLPLMLSHKAKLTGKDLGQDIKTPGEPKININFEIKNLNIFKTPGSAPIKRGHRKNITNLEPPKSSQQTLKKGKIKAKLSVDKNSSKPQMHRKAKSQDIQVPKAFDADKFLRDQPDRSIVCKFSATSKAGVLDNKTKKNQDAYVCMPRFVMNNSMIFSVFDGHGANGHFVSDFVKEILPENIEYYSIRNKIFLKEHKRDQVQQVLKQAFKKTSIDLQQSQIDINFSGSTAVLTLLIQNHLYCANIGDSRAIICSFSEQDQWKAKPLSIDHKAQVPTEAQRILKNRGRLEPYRDQNGEEMGPYRVWLRTEQIPGLAMTRSFGDYVASTVGVIAEPEITYHQINKNDKFMIIASDGLWEFISNEEAMSVVAPCFIRNDADDAVKQLEQLSVASWMEEDELIDDITILVVFFPNY